MLKSQAPYQGLAEIQAETQANDTPIQICIVLYSIPYAGADVRSSDQRSHAHCSPRGCVRYRIRVKQHRSPVRSSNQTPGASLDVLLQLYSSLCNSARGTQGLSDDPIGGLALLATRGLE